MPRPVEFSTRPPIVTVAAVGPLTVTAPFVGVIAKFCAWSFDVEIFESVSETVCAEVPGATVGSGSV